MKYASFYKVTVFKSTSLHHTKHFLGPLLIPLSPAASPHACRAEARELMCPWASNGRSLPNKIKPTVLVVNILFYFIFFYPQMNCDCKAKKKEAPFHCTQMLPSHLSEYKYTPQQTHIFTQCEFTLITASAIGSEETVQGI